MMFVIYWLILKKEYIDIHTYRKMLLTDGLLPRAYQNT